MDVIMHLKIVCWFLPYYWYHDTYRGHVEQFIHSLYTLRFDKVQNDPFAPPSRMRIHVNRSIAGFPADLYADKES